MVEILFILVCNIVMLTYINTQVNKLQKLNTLSDSYKEIINEIK